MFFGDQEFRDDFFQNQVDVQYDIIYGVDSSPQPKQPISRIKNPTGGKPLILPIFLCYSQSSFLVIQNFKMIFTKTLHGCMLRPYQSSL